MERKRKTIFRILLCNVVFNTVLALLLTAAVNKSALYANLILLQCIGIIVFSVTLPALHLIKFKRLERQPVIVMTAVLASIWLIALFASRLYGKDILSFLRKEYAFAVQIAIFNVIFVSVAAYVIISRNKISTATTLTEQERNKRLDGDRKVAEMSLRLLQAQIEPHFLFNTLSNILRLLDTDPDNGRAMLVDFMGYLRMTLAGSRSLSTTLGQEAEMMGAYLNIFKMRMGERLRYSIEIPDNLKDIAIPSMLLQPLVENAISHGLQPKVTGGEISVRAQKTGEILRIDVCDTGVGFGNSGGGLGTGIGYVREKLNSKSPDGNRGRLTFMENEPCGVRATIELSHDADKSDPRRR
ncbi:MAG: histidine kinase [Syntrophobacteraceae bacterium]|nr:histidine kinase [Syntrophobacteraceae bacterium]